MQNYGGSGGKLRHQLIKVSRRHDLRITSVQNRISNSTAILAVMWQKREEQHQANLSFSDQIWMERKAVLPNFGAVALSPGNTELAIPAELCFT